MHKKLLLLSFLEGGAVMAAELCGAKLLAPVYGGSLYVWASVMGFTLGALALGYFYGGRLTTRIENQRKNLRILLNLAAFFVMTMPIISFYLVPRLSYLPFLGGVIICSGSLLFFPVFMLGATSPFFIALQSNQKEAAGQVSGMVYAVSTTGGILATFLCGFWLIPSLGLSTCLLTFGGVLFIANNLVNYPFKASNLVLFAGLIYFHGRLHSSSSGTLLLSEGLLGRVEVKEVLSDKSDTFRYIALNGIIQTERHSNPTIRNGNYLDLFDTLLSKRHLPGKALLLGLGGGLSANLLVKKNYQVDAVELDNRMINIARQFFDLNPGVNTVLDDARHYLNQCQGRYDLVLFDVFKAEEQPSHVLTAESLERLKRNLHDSSLVLINWHGYLDGETGMGSAILFNTLLKSGYHVKLCALPGAEDARNIVFVASLTSLKRLIYELETEIEPVALLNTDTRPLMERYNAEANKKWRLNYLRYYQK